MEQHQHQRCADVSFFAEELLLSSAVRNKNKAVLREGGGRRGGGRWGAYVPMITSSHKRYRNKKSVASKSRESREISANQQTALIKFQ